MFYLIIGGLILLAVLFIGAIATMLLPILVALIVIVVVLIKIYLVLSPAAPAVAEKTAEITQIISTMIC